MHELLAPIVFILHCDHQAFSHASEAAQPRQAYCFIFKVLNIFLLLIKYIKFAGLEHINMCFLIIIYN